MKSACCARVLPYRQCEKISYILHCRESDIQRAVILKVTVSIAWSENHIYVSKPIEEKIKAEIFKNLPYWECILINAESYLPLPPHHWRCPVSVLVLIFTQAHSSTRPASPVFCHWLEKTHRHPWVIMKHGFLQTLPLRLWYCNWLLNAKTQTF